MLFIFVVRNITIYIRGFYMMFLERIFWLGARAVEGILEAQAESPVEGVFW